MATMILDDEFGERLRQERVESGADRWDEVWEGIYMMAPLPNNEHQELVTRLSTIFQDTVGWSSQSNVFPGTNVSDRELGWAQNYRCPDVAVFLPSNPAKDCGTHWCGGPDLAVEIVSDDDRTRDKIPFYAKVRTRELLIVDRAPWSLELLRFDGQDLITVGKSALTSERILVSEVMPLSFTLRGGQNRPIIQLLRSTDHRTWDV